MPEYINRHDALNFDTSIEADPDDIGLISEGMALYGEYIKGLPVIKREEGSAMFWLGILIGSVFSTVFFALIRAGRGN